MNSDGITFSKSQLDLKRRVAGRHACAVTDTKHMRIHRHGVFAIGHVEHDIGGLAPGAGQRLDFGAGARHLAAELGDQLLGQRDHIPGLVAIEPDGLDVVAHFLLAERQHLRRRVGDREQRTRRLVDAGVGRLRRQHHGDKQRVGVEMFELTLRLRIGFAKTAERLVDLGRRPGLWLLRLWLRRLLRSPLERRLDGLLCSFLRHGGNAGFSAAGRADDFGHDRDILIRDDSRQRL